MRLLTCLLCVLSLTASAGEEPAPEIDLGEPLLRISNEEAHSTWRSQTSSANCRRFTTDSCRDKFASPIQDQ